MSKRGKGAPAQAAGVAAKQAGRQQAAARQAAAKAVRRQAQRRQRTLWTSVLAAVGLLLAGLLGWGIYASQRPASFQTPAHATADGTGLVDGTGPVTVEIYLDYLCPACRRYEEVAGPTLNELVADGSITRVIHPIAILDPRSTNRYSTRSAAAAGCAADGGAHVAFTGALFATQPAENGPGLTDAELIDVGAGVGLTDPAFAQCVTSGRYLTWVRHTTDAATAAGVTGTPTVRVNGADVELTVEALRAAVAAATP